VGGGLFLSFLHFFVNSGALFWFYDLFLGVLFTMNLKSHRVSRDTISFFLFFLKCLRNKFYAEGIFRKQKTELHSQSAFLGSVETGPRTSDIGLWPDELPTALSAYVPICR